MAPHAKQLAPFTEEDVRNRIWLRRAGEPRKAYQAFEVYLAMEGERSLRLMQLPFHLAQRSREFYSSKYEWMKRACAYDAHMEAVAQAERERLRREREATWEARREQIRENEFRTAEKLRARVEEMLAVPLFEVKEEETQEEGGECINKITIIAPAGWRFRDVGRLAEVTSKLHRLSAEMATDRTEIDVDVKNASDEELEAITKAR